MTLLTAASCDARAVVASPGLSSLLFHLGAQQAATAPEPAHTQMRQWREAVSLDARCSLRKYATCSLVITSPEASSFASPAEIDSNEAVFRLDRDPVGGLEAHVGRRTTCARIAPTLHIFCCQLTLRHRHARSHTRPSLPLTHARARVLSHAQSA
jgi:hypothetical protein